MNVPKTLQEAVVFFSDPNNCIDFLVTRRWPDGMFCPACGRTDADRFSKIVTQVVSKRLTYAESTGKLSARQDQTAEPW